jgi:SAM-dependent methyltransferase
MPYCCICDQSVQNWLPYPHSDQRSPLMAVFDAVGSDPRHFKCPVCASHDRDRHLWLYMRASGLVTQLKGARILHMAPERHLEVLIEAAEPGEYIRGDLHPQRANQQRIDLEALPFDDNSLDLIICNHVLEHVAQPMQALSEMQRVLKPGGILIAQTPYAPSLIHTLEMHTPPDARTAHLLYGQTDHVRLFGSDIADYFHAAGFKGDLLHHEALLPQVSGADFGCNTREPFFVFWKPQGTEADSAVTQQEAVPA